jgi:DMSO/TMAO reductase YedYZ molybdopterin-dependent catalytic subunit
MNPSDIPARQANEVREKSVLPCPAVSSEDAERKIQRMTRRSFAVGGAAALLGVGGWYWLQTRKVTDGIPWPLRRMLEFNESLAQRYFNDTRLAPTFPLDRAREPRINGKIGLITDLDAAGWKLQIETPAQKAHLAFSLGQIKAQPRTEMVTELKCVEGWSQVVQWAGVRFRDFLQAYRLGTHSGKAPDPAADPGDLFPYVELETPDGDYYVGLDMPSALHPQTLLCYEMNGAPLTLRHGAPLRLVATVKYGFKSIKRIGRIRFLDERAADFWAERGYDWHSGL